MIVSHCPSHNKISPRRRSSEASQFDVRLGRRGRFIEC